MYVCACVRAYTVSCVSFSWGLLLQEGGLAISRAIGDVALSDSGVVATPEKIVKPITPEDRFVVMASDGVWDKLSNLEVVTIASHHHDPRKASEAVVKEARRRWELADGYIDDITAVVVRL
eukprot:m.162359 g.162359  ORF g.162359 m.162359 type:complete len:121 (-) comp21001_c2_seq4:40-402(-)